MSVETKPWWQSLTIWSALATIVSSLLLAAGVLDPAAAGLLAEAGPDALLALVSAVAGVCGLVGRLRAKMEIRR